jgi:hypothetical protein
MKTLLRKSICTAFIILVPLFVVSISFGSMLPEGLVMADTFQPGYGHPIGSVHLVQGEVVILHKDEMLGYWAQKDLPLFKGDTIVTKERGRIRLQLKDESVLTLASKTKLVITQSVYEPAKKTRSTFINMAFGKAKFWAKKFATFKRSQFKVKSITAVVGIRGSQWVEEVTMDATKVTALGNTTIEVVSIAALEVEPTVLEAFEQTIVEIGQLPTEVIKISPEEIEQIKGDFTIIPEGEGTEAKLETEKGKSKKKEAADEKSADKEDESDAETSVTLVLVEEPEDSGGIEEPVIEGPVVLDIGIIDQYQTDVVTELQEQILEQISEESLVPPDFPGPPT